MGTRKYSALIYGDGPLAIMTLAAGGRFEKGGRAGTPPPPDLTQRIQDAQRGAARPASSPPPPRSSARPDQPPQPIDLAERIRQSRAR